jgi:hypothetical protein
VQDHPNDLALRVIDTAALTIRFGVLLILALCILTYPGHGRTVPLTAWNFFPYGMVVYAALVYHASRERGAWFQKLRWLAASPGAGPVLPEPTSSEVEPPVKKVQVDPKDIFKN